MQIIGFPMSRNLLLAGVVTLIFGMGTAFAKDSVNGADMMAAAPTNLTSGHSDNPTDVSDENGMPQISDSALVPNDGSAAPTASPEFMAGFGPSSGTSVGNRARELRDEILRLRASVNLNSNEFSVLRSSGAAGAVQYHSTVAAITARLQNGTTRGNPILLRQWDEANASLDEVTSSLNRLNSLATAIDADASMASYLAESIQAAFQLSGAVDEDHDQLKLLKDEDNRLVVQLDYLRNQTTGDIQRQTTYLTTERSNLQALAFAISRGELLGNSLANRPVIVNPMPFATLPGSGMTQTSFESPPMAAPMGAVTAGMAGPSPMSPREMMRENGMTPSIAATSSVAQSIGQLLVLIRYDQPHVEYEQQLSQAVGSALEHRPNAEFSIVAVSPASGDSAGLAKLQQTAQANAEAVKRSLVQLGLPPSRLSIANTQLPSVQTPEVHVYIR